jgi:hypothetical protein
MATLADLQAERERLRAASAKADFEAALAATCDTKDLVAAGNALRRLLLDALDALPARLLADVSGAADVVIIPPKKDPHANRNPAR